jgi:hypothetical protein
VRDANGTFVLTLPVANQLAADFTQVAGVVTSSTGFAGGAAPLRAITLDTPLVGTVTGGPQADASRDAGAQRAAGPVGRRCLAPADAVPCVPRRADPEPHALRFSGAVAERPCPSPSRGTAIAVTCASKA